MTTNSPHPDRPDGINVEASMHMFARHPHPSAHLLSRMLYEETRGNPRFTMKMWLTVAAHVISYISRPPFDAGDSKRFIARVKRLPLKKALRMSLRFPESGSRVVALVIYEELARGQGFSPRDLVEFVNMFIGIILDDLYRQQASPSGRAHPGGARDQEAPPRRHG